MPLEAAESISCSLHAIYCCSVKDLIFNKWIVYIHLSPRPFSSNFIWAVALYTNDHSVHAINIPDLPVSRFGCLAEGESRNMWQESYQRRASLRWILVFCQRGAQCDPGNVTICAGWTSSSNGNSTLSFWCTLRGSKTSGMCTWIKLLRI